MPDPILIMAMPRSGSSMTAGIFSQHGVWSGTCRQGTGRNPKGFFENIRIREVVRNMQGSIVHGGRLGKEKPGFREAIENAVLGDGYGSGPWFWKGSALYWPAWFEFDPTWIVVRRDKESTFKSCRRAPKVFSSNMSDSQLWANINLHHEQMDRLVDEGAVEVDTRAVASGNFTTIRAAIESCGLEFNETVTREFVDPKLWHHK